MTADMFVRFPGDDPHRLGDGTVSVCNLDMSAAKVISEAQVLAFLDNRRCPGCFPSYASTTAARFAPRVGRPVRWAA